MTRTDPTESRMSLWPDAGQLLLLHAALGDGEQARAAFADWCAVVDIQTGLDGGTYRLLPLVYANQTRLKARHPMLPKLAGVYRLSWCEEQRRLRKASEVTARLRQSGVPVMASKGLALATCYYESPGLRPSSDIDLIVPIETMPRAIALLRDMGWMPPAMFTQAWTTRRDDLLTVAHAVELKDESGFEIDLHWRMSSDIRQHRFDEAVWQAALPLRCAELEAQRPSPTHLLLHTILHGVRPNLLPPLRWIADAAMILRKDGHAIDWAGMAATARGARLEGRLLQGLEYLRDTMRIALPAEAFSALSGRLPLVERIERRAFAAMMRSPSPKRHRMLDRMILANRLAADEQRAQLPSLVFDWLRRNALRVGRASG